jgi:hypothetical protein
MTPAPRHDLAVRGPRYPSSHVIGRCYQRHRAVEFRRFLAHVKLAVPSDLDIHLVLDNYAAHTAPLVMNL